jgi:hypothetical protein
MDKKNIIIIGVMVAIGLLAFVGLRTYGPFRVGACGCTRTYGYWKNHDWGGAAHLRDETFFNTGQTWLEVFLTKPKGGPNSGINKYYILAHQFIAAQININNGADSPPELPAAETLISDYSNKMDEIEDDGKKVEFTDLATALDTYNNGLAIGGPPHCDD